jgi:hypothetical protein
MENVLARFLFGPYSKFRQPIDVLVKKVGALPPEDFTQHVVKLCIDIMPEESYTSTEQSTVLLILLRTVFNRCYEVNSSYFMHTTDHALLSKLFILGRGAAKRLPLPWRILGGQETNESLPEFFGHFSFYLSAAQFFYGAIFEPNPMDALWHVHKCLVAIQKAALIHGSGGEVVSQSELHRLLSFDDMFALLFGVALTSEIPDLFYIAKLIGNFAPKGLLSASFEYAWATLDALATHCAQVTIDDAPE